MSEVDLHQEGQWIESTSILSSLSMLLLEDCELDNMSPSLEYVNFTSLTVLSLYGNHFSHEIPNWLSNLTTNLLKLDLRDNSLKGHIPITILELRYLNILYLSRNQLTGQIPEYLGQLKHLEALSLRYNSFDGPIPSSLGNLSSLRSLYLYGNRLNGTLPSSLWLLSNLEDLEIGNNSLSGIVDIAPTWFWKWASHIEWIYLSDNQISGDLSGVWLNNTIIYLNSNCFTGLLPAVSPNVTSLTHVNLGNNNFSGKIPDSISSLFSLKALHLQNNGLSGSIPSSLRGCTSLGLLDLKQTTLTKHRHPDSFHKCVRSTIHPDNQHGLSGYDCPDH
ncbi:unnamed protein product, partial [Vitis vinifera]